MGQNASSSNGSAGVVSPQAFLRAAKDGNDAIIKKGMQYKLKLVYARNSWTSQTAWHVASQHGHVNVLRTMVEGLRFAQAGPDQFKSLLKWGHSTDAILAALANDRDVKDRHALILAAMYGHAECVELLMSVGASPWVGDALGNRTALHYAASLGHAEVIRALLEKPPRTGPIPEDLIPPNKPDTKLIDLQNLSGFTALHYAVWAGEMEALRALISFDATLTVKSGTMGVDWITCDPGATPLHLAAMKGDMELCRLLLAAYVESIPTLQGFPARNQGRRKPDPRRQKNRDGKLPYHLARSYRHRHILELLHPEVPYSFLFTGRDAPEETRMYGPPRLAVIAGSALQQKLLDEIDLAVEVEEQLAAEKKEKREAARAARMELRAQAAAQEGATVPGMCGLNSATSSTIARAAGDSFVAGPRAAMMSFNRRSSTLQGPQVAAAALAAAGSGPSLRRSVSSAARGVNMDVLMALHNTPSTNNISSLQEGMTPQGSLPPSKPMDISMAMPSHMRNSLKRHGSNLSSRQTSVAATAAAAAAAAGDGGSPQGGTLSSHNSVSNVADAAAGTPQMNDSGGSHMIPDESDSGPRRAAPRPVIEQVPVSYDDVPSFPVDEHPMDIMLGSELVHDEGSGELPAVDMRERFRRMQLSSGVLDRSTVEQIHRSISTRIRESGGSMEMQGSISNPNLPAMSGLVPMRSDPTAAIAGNAGNAGPPLPPRPPAPSRLGSVVGAAVHPQLTVIAESSSATLEGKSSLGASALVHADSPFGNALMLPADCKAELQRAAPPTDSPAVETKMSAAMMLAETMSRCSLNDEDCGICLENYSNLTLLTCDHKLCAGCCKELCKLHQYQPALCPFCRCVIKGFKLATQ